MKLAECTYVHIMMCVSLLFGWYGIESHKARNQYDVYLFIYFFCVKKMMIIFENQVIY